MDWDFVPKRSTETGFRGQENQKFERDPLEQESGLKLHVDIGVLGGFVSGQR